VAQGLTCLLTAPDGGNGVCGYGVAEAAGKPVYCGGPCTSYPCVLGASCQPPSGSETDPCAAAGLYCDETNGVCRLPNEGDPCSPGGPACQPIPGSTASDLQCLDLPPPFEAEPTCLQPCNASDPQHGTSDCVDPLMVCTSLGKGLGSVCSFDIIGPECPGGDYFGACNSAGTGDGLCVPYNFPGGTEGLCYQTALDGGAPGDPCEEDGNRQIGGLCNGQSYCSEGVCLPICNAGTPASPACAPAQDGGTASSCLPYFAQTGGSDDFGLCSAACDFTSATGGGCVSPQGSDGTPEKCLPQLIFGLPDAVTGLCVGAPAAGTAVAVGQPCTLRPGADDCVDGALCIQYDYAATCVQLCNQVGTTGQAPCGAGSTCEPLAYAPPYPTHTGFCDLPDGGV
jgi:hypothetical protein